MFVHLKAQLSFCSGEPALVTSMASRNSVKSIKPLLSLSNVLNTANNNKLTIKDRTVFRRSTVSTELLSVA